MKKMSKGTDVMKGATNAKAGQTANGKRVGQGNGKGAAGVGNGGMKSGRTANGVRKGG